MQHRVFLRTDTVDVLDFYVGWTYKYKITRIFYKKLQKKNKYNAWVLFALT